MLRFRLPSLFVVFLGTATLALAQMVPVTTDSEDARAHFEKGRHAASNVQFDKARMHFDAALEADPEFVLAHLYRAAFSPPEKRAAHLEKAKRHLADASEGERMMVEAYEAGEADDYDGEVALYTSIAERYTDDPYPHLHLGWAHYGAERYDDALAAAERALAADANFAAAYNIIGYSELAQEDHAAAEEAFKNYVRLAPDEANPYDSLGELYLNMERYDEAAELFEKALARDPDFTASRTNLARIGIEKANRKFMEAVAAQDADALAGLYTANAMMLPPNSEPVQGRDAIKERIASMFAAGVDGLELETEEVRTMGNYAHELGSGTVRAGGEVVDEFKFSVLWVKDGDAWRLHRDMWNSNRPAAPTVAAEN
ncbi:MAG: SgcJ/EcaC family oxidoreductase [Rhodothermales bacterium]|nr:SgcJ/EcaC family oxidoreductase [Rhodothermales bacterium]